MKIINKSIKFYFFINLGYYLSKIKKDYFSISISNWNFLPFDQRFEFYKKIEENKLVKERIFKLLYDNYLNSV